MSGGRSRRTRGSRMALIHLIRHAATTMPGVMLGRLDPPMAAAPAPSALDVEAVFSSPLRRALETAEFLFPHHTPRVLPELAEISFGDWEGLPWLDIEQRWPDLSAAKLHDWTGITPPGGEPWSAFEQRAAAAWQIIRQSAGPCAVVAHSGVNAVLMQLATGAPALSFRQDYCEVITLDL